MILERLKLTNFKNYTSRTLECSPSINVIYGNNGTGKTNLLDAIYFLSFGKSHFNLSDSALILDGQDFYRIEGAYRDGEKHPMAVAAKYKRDSRKTFEVNAKKVKQIKDLIGKVPVVLVAPDDMTIVHGGSKVRRDYINRILCQSDKEYLAFLLRYNRILRQKNALLKSDRSVQYLEVKIYNDQLVPLAKEIHRRRDEKIKRISQLVQQHYSAISSSGEQITMVYESQMYQDDIENRFETRISDELRARRPLIGIQRDDIAFSIFDKPFKKFGSQGQLKTLLYSLRMAEYFYLDDCMGTKPILLLDDYFEKLDQSRLSELLKMIHDDRFGQVFLTDTELSRSQKILEEHGIQYQSHLVTGSEI